MVKMLFFAVVFLMTPYCIFAQISLGARVTPPFTNGNIATGNIGNDLDTSVFFPPPNIGLLLKYRFNERFALQTEIALKREGLRYTFLYDIVIEPCPCGYTFSPRMFFELGFFEIPLLFQMNTLPFSLGRRSEFRGFAETGVSFKFLAMANHYHEEPHYGGNIFAHSYYDRSYFNTFGLTANIGAGIIADLWNNFSVFTSFRVGYDLLPIGRKITDRTINETWTFNNVRFFHWAMFIGIKYNF